MKIRVILAFLLTSQSFVWAGEPFVQNNQQVMPVDQDRQGQAEGLVQQMNQMWDPGQIHQIDAQEGEEFLVATSPDGSMSAYLQDRVVPTIIIGGVNCPEYMEEQCKFHAQDILILRNAAGQQIGEFHLYENVQYDYSNIKKVEFSPNGNFVGIHYANTEPYVAYADRYQVVTSTGEGVTEYFTRFDLGVEFTVGALTNNSVEITYQSRNIETYHQFPVPAREARTDTFVFGSVNGRVVTESSNGEYRVIVSKEQITGYFPFNPSLIAMEEKITLQRNGQTVTSFRAVDPYLIANADPTVLAERTAGVEFVGGESYFAVRTAWFNGPTRLNQYQIYNLNGVKVFDLKGTIAGGAHIDSLAVNGNKATISFRRELPSSYEEGRYYSTLLPNVITIQKDFSRSSAPIAGDVNGDGFVNQEDLGILVRNFGLTSGAMREAGDLNGDGRVNLRDVAFVQANWGTVPVIAQAAPAAVLQAAPQRRRVAEEEIPPVRLRAKR